MYERREYRFFKARSDRRSWLVIIAVAILFHLAVFLFFKPEYLTIFKTDMVGDEGSSSLYLENRPFSLIPLAEPSETPAERVSVQKSIEPDAGPVTLDELGEPSSEILPLPRSSGGGSAGRAGSRKTTVEPKPLYIPWPKYPDGVDESIAGTVELLLFVNERGEVENVKITQRLPDEKLNQTAAYAARKIRFTPGFEKGVPTAMWVRLTIGFQPR
ncbi:MAG TPA: TonB family protein [Patescibacteria group bacterium]|nr:TonB family protein [Patescibacteria group bacterium]